MYDLYVFKILQTLYIVPKPYPLVSTNSDFTYAPYMEAHATLSKT